MRIVIFDSETTGLPVKGDLLSPLQPWVVQLAAVKLVDFEMKSSMNALVRPPEGTVFNERAVQVHGLTEELCRAEGRNPVEVFTELRDMAADADLVAAYNLAFDDRIINSCSLRADFEEFTQRPVFGEQSQKHCIMNHATIYFKGRRKLGQAYQMLLGKPLTDAHDAFADTLAAAEVFKALIAKTML